MPTAKSRRVLVEEAVQLADIEELLFKGEGLPEGTANAGEATHAEEAEKLRKAAIKMALDMSADQAPFAIRFLGFVLTTVWRSLYGGRVLANASGLQEVVEVSKTCNVIYLPTHKSHLDYLLLSYVLYSVGLTSPIIAAGVNLNVPFVGQLCRWFGAFYIARSTRGKTGVEVDLYRKVQRAYLNSLLMNSMPVEFFIEAGRTRDGRIAVPRLGLLSAAVDAQLDLQLPRPLAVVPVSISYDSPLEEPAMMLQLMGRPKKKESFFGFVHACFEFIRKALCSSLFGHTTATHGMAIVSFGKLQTIPQYTEEHLSHGHKVGDGLSSRGAQLGSPEATSPKGREPPDAAANIADHGSRETGPATRYRSLMPRGSDARRRLVGHLGAYVSEQQRAANVVPQTALLAAAVAMPFSLKAQPAAASGGSARDEGGWRALPEVNENAGWLMEELCWRGQKAMAISHAHGPPSGNHDEVLQVAEILCGCLEVKTSSSRTTHTHPNRQIRVARTRHARCQLQSRLNQLMPAFAAEGLVVCALLAANRRVGRHELHRTASEEGCRAAGPSTTHCGGHTELPEATATEAHASRGADGARDTVTEEHVVKTAVWLRGLFSAELDCHLGQGALSDATSMRKVIHRMLNDGALVGLPDGRSGAPRLLRIAPSPMSTSRRAALFAGWLMAPLCSMHACALRKADQLLSGSPSGCVTMGELLEGMRTDMVSGSACGQEDVVANLVMAENAITGLCRAGLLVGVAPPAPGSSAAADAPLRRAMSGWDLPTADTASGLPSIDLCKVLESFSSSACVAIAPMLSASGPRAVESLADHILSFVVR